MKVYFHTLGCKVNRYETEQMLSDLESVGFTETKKLKEADVMVVNSCVVTHTSEQKTRQLTRKLKRENPKGILVLTGCMPQAFPIEAEKLPADIILGNSSSRDIVGAVTEYLKNHNPIVEIEPHTKGEAFGEGCLEKFTERTRAYMKIEDGCDRCCTYCIIPKARGRVRSRSLMYIKKEAENLVKCGFCEIVLVGINLSSYGKDLNLTLADAVEAISQVKGIERIRLGSLEPDLTDDPLLERLKKIPQFCPQFHLSLQSGCDATLKRMNRHYTAEEYYSLSKKIHSLWDNASLTTDIMVGFIGETDEEFKESLNFAKKVGFLKAHIFPYSVRDGTFAANLEGRVDESVKNRRAKEMAEECEKTSKEIIKSLGGKKRKVLFERTENGYTEGYSEDYIRVFVPADSSLCGKIKEVELTSGFKDGIMAEIIK